MLAYGRKIVILPFRREVQGGQEELDRSGTYCVSGVWDCGGDGSSGVVENRVVLVVVFIAAKARPHGA